MIEGVESLRREIERLRTRLEISPDDPGRDGITRREERIAELETENARLHERLEGEIDRLRVELSRWQRIARDRLRTMRAKRKGAG